MSNMLFQALSNASGNTMINNMLSGLQRANPQAYSQLQGILHSGNQEQAIMNMVNQLNPQQVGEFKNMANMIGIDVSKYLKL